MRHLLKRLFDIGITQLHPELFIQTLHKRATHMSGPHIQLICRHQLSILIIMNIIATGLGMAPELRQVGFLAQHLL
jgi:hypothetical protein